MINVYAPINNLGYGIHSFNLLKELDKLGVEIALFPPNDSASVSNSLVEKWIKNQSKFSPNDIGFMLYHESHMNKFCGKSRIGLPVFETGLTERDKKIMGSLDYILQVSEWGKAYLESQGFNNVHVVPEGFDPIIYDINKYSYDTKVKVLDSVGLVFSHIGKWEERKSSKDILRVFTQSLEGEKLKCKLLFHVMNVFLPNWELIVKNELLGLGYELINQDNFISRYNKNNLIVLVPRCGITHVNDIYQQSHFGLYASKAEGWNLPLIESIASGTPCVTTNWTGQSEYLNSYPEKLIIPKGEEVIANDGIWFHGNKGNWITPDLSAMKSILRAIVKEPLKYLQLKNKCYECVQNFTWENSATKFIEVINSIGGKL